VDEPDAETAAAYEEPEYAAQPAEPRRRGAVPLVRGSATDSNRDTHTSMRVPGPDELAGGARGTARAPRTPGQRRPGSARHKAEAVRRRRITLGVAALVLAVAAGVGGWLATSGDDTSAPPEDSKQSAPAQP
jgi:serine/threonine-protein kinase